MVTDGIDVSQYQGKIDWQEVKKNINFAILRVGYGQNRRDQDDKRFIENADACTRLNIPFGVYIYSYAKNEMNAISEANHVLRLVKGYKLAYPVYYDLEDEGTTGKLTNQEIGNIAKAFGDTMESNGYFVGVYASLYWWQEKLTSPVFNKYTKWIARYSDNLNYNGTYGMWQYTDEGTVPGIIGPVDLNYGYVDFPTIIKELGYNGYGSIDNEPMMKYRIGDMVEFDYLFISSDSMTPIKTDRRSGIITEIKPGARNPYLINRELGWVNDDVIID